MTDIVETLLKKANQTTHTLCVVLGAYSDVRVLFAGDGRIHDWIRECGPDGPDNGLDDPPGKGVWIWEGVFAGGQYMPYAGDYADVDLKGTFRHMNDHEMERFLAGNSPFDHEPFDEEIAPTQPMGSGDNDQDDDGEGSPFVEKSNS